MGKTHFETNQRAATCHQMCQFNFIIDQVRLARTLQCLPQPTQGVGMVFHTTTGYIGIGPRCAQPGDVVAILYGSNLPMVMRSLPGLPKGRYSLLGASYVNGIMDGEAVRRHQEMGLEDDVFRIV